MKNMKLIIFTLLISFVQCNTKRFDKFNTIFNSIEKKYDKKILKEFRETPESEVLDVYFSYFLFEYGELRKTNPDIELFFKSENINEEPSQAYVFLLLWHRNLNHKDFDFDELTHALNDTIVGIKTCKNQKRINSISNFKKLNKGDHIKLIFPVRISDGDSTKSTVFYGCPVLDWNFDRSKDLIINGELIDKYYNSFEKGPTKEFYIQLRIEDINREDVLYFLKKIHKNDTIEVNLNSYGIKI